MPHLKSGSRGSRSSERGEALRHRIWFANLTICCTLAAVAQSTSAQDRRFIPPERNLSIPAPTILHESSAARLSVPPFSFYDEAQCDSDGDAFFNISPGYRLVRVFELTQDPGKSVLYKLPPDDASAVYEAFTVGPSGELYVLGVAREGNSDSDVHHYVFSFSDDGSMADKVRLEVSPYLSVNTFTALEGGSFLIAGRFVKAPGSPEPPGKRYTALFDASGRLIKNLGGIGKVGTGEYAGTAATRGKDGYAYFVDQTEILVVSPGGDTVRRLPFTNPYYGSAPTAIQISQGMLSIMLSKVDKDGRVEPRYLLLNSLTGDVEGYYQPSDELGNEMLCFSRTSGFTFLHRTDGGNGLEVLTAALR